MSRQNNKDHSTLIQKAIYTPYHDCMKKSRVDEIDEIDEILKHAKVLLYDIISHRLKNEEKAKEGRGKIRATKISKSL
jgi:hypothetical protein